MVKMKTEQYKSYSNGESQRGNGESEGDNGESQMVKW